MPNIDIKIRRKRPRLGKKGGNLRRGPVDIRAEADELGRRRKTGTVNFWDLGQIKDGSSYIDLPFYFNSGYQYDINFPYFPVLNLAPSQSDMDGLESLIFDIPLSEWRDNYRQVVYDELAERYGLSITIGSTVYEVGADSKWTDAGLRVKLPDVFDISGFQGFSSIAIGTNSVKITSTRNYSDVAVIPRFSSNVDVFLMPRVVLLRSNSIKNVGGSPALLAFDSAFFQYSLLPREYFLQNIIWASGSTLANPEINTSFIDFFKTKASSVIGEVWRAYGYITTPNPGAPPPETSPTSIASYPDGTIVNSQLDAGFELPGLLLAVVQSGGNTYYVWRNS